MRTFSALVKSALSGASVVCRFIVRGTLPSGTYAATDAPSDLTWDNGSGPIKYTALADALRITLPGQDAQSKVNQATLAFSATDPVMLATLFDEQYRAAPCQIAQLLFDPATGAPGEEIILVDGLIDTGSITDQPAKATDPSQPQISTLSLTISPRIVDIKRASGRVASDSDQRLNRDPNDGFFQDVALVALSTINWGIAGSQSPTQAASHPVGVPGVGGLYGLPPFGGLPGAYL